jgi:hypothetical protein
MVFHWSDQNRRMPQVNRVRVGYRQPLISFYVIIHTLKFPVARARFELKAMYNFITSVNIRIIFLPSLLVAMGR